MLSIALDPAKFKDALVTAKGEQRAHVALRVARDAVVQHRHAVQPHLPATATSRSSPRNDRLVYLTAAEVADYLDEIERDGLGTRLIGFTGGEPFMNPELPAMLEDVLSRGFKAHGADQRHEADAQDEAGAARRCASATATNLTIRVSIDHYGAAAARGRARRAQLEADHRRADVAGRQAGFDVHVAGRRFSDETEEQRARAAIARLFAELGVADRCRRARWRWCCFRRWIATVDVPEITDGVLGHPEEVARQRDVRLLAHGGQAQGRGAARRRRLHAAALRPAVRARHDPGRARRRGAASTIRIAPSSASWAAPPAASDDDHSTSSSRRSNAAATLRARLAALRAAEPLSHRSITVCDGGSRDDTAGHRPRECRRHRRRRRARTRRAARRGRRGGQRTVAPLPACRHGAWAAAGPMPCSASCRRRRTPAKPAISACASSRRTARARRIERLRRLALPDVSACPTAIRAC